MRGGRMLMMSLRKRGVLKPGLDCYVWDNVVEQRGATDQTTDDVATVRFLKRQLNEWTEGICHSFAAYTRTLEESV